MAEFPDMSAIKSAATGALDSARQLGQEATAKSSSTISILSTSAKDGIQAIDGFGKSVNDVLTESRNTVAGKIAAAKEWLTTTDIAGLGSFNDILKTAADLKKEAENLQKQISDTVSNGIGTVRGLTNSVLGPAEDVLAKLNELPLDKLTDGKYWLNVAIGTNASDLNNLGNLATRLLGKVEAIKEGYQDQWGRLALAIGIADHAVTLGDSTILGAVMDQYGDEVTLRESIIARFPDAVSQGNTALIMTMVTKFGADYLLVNYPDAISIILTSYRTPIGATVNDDALLGEKLLEVLTAIDPDWSKAHTVNNALHNVKVFMQASIHTQRVLRYHSDIIYLLYIANNYGVGDVVTVARNQYPLAGLTY